MTGCSDVVATAGSRGRSNTADGALGNTVRGDPVTDCPSDGCAKSP